MTRNRTSISIWLLAVSAVTLSFLMYGSGYFLLSYSVANGNNARVRIFPHLWLMFVYVPAVQLESLATGEDVRIAAKATNAQPPNP